MKAAYPPLNATLQDVINEVDMATRREAGVFIEPTASDRQEGGQHYKKMGVEPWDVVDTWPREQQIGYYRGGALKYIMRMGNKDANSQEIAKGLHYIEKLLEVLKK